MTRKRMVYIISILTLIVGIAWIWSFLLPILDSSKPIVLNPILAIFGILFLLTGLGLFRLSEFALESAFWLWFISLMQTILTAFFSLADKSGSATTVNYRAIIFFSVLIAVNLFVVIFLGQKETKKLFAQEEVGNDSANVEQEL
jgi:hypothetical protein